MRFFLGHVSNQTDVVYSGIDEKVKTELAKAREMSENQYSSKGSVGEIFKKSLEDRKKGEEILDVNCTKIGTEKSFGDDGYKSFLSVDQKAQIPVLKCC